jgi:hypothetical protein
MKFGIKCKVDSTTEIGKEPVQVTLDGRDFTLVPSEEGLLSELEVIVGIENDEAFISQVAPSKESDKAPWAVTVDFDRQIFDSLIEMAQYLEGVLSLLYGVKKSNYSGVLEICQRVQHHVEYGHDARRRTASAATRE